MEFTKSKNEPFVIVKCKNDKFAVCVGDGMVTEPQFNTVKEAEDYINRKPYKLIINTVFYILSKSKENKKETKKTAKSSKKD